MKNGATKKGWKRSLRLESGAEKRETERKGEGLSENKRVRQEGFSARGLQKGKVTEPSSAFNTWEDHLRFFFFGYPTSHSAFQVWFSSFITKSCFL